MEDQQKPLDQQEKKPEETKNPPEQPATQSAQEENLQGKNTEEQAAQEKSTQQEQTQVQSSNPPPDVQQPHLIQTNQVKQKSRRIPAKSFIIAIVTIGITIAIGIAIALYFGNLTKRKLIVDEKPVTPQITSKPTQSPIIPTVEEKVPLMQKESTVSSFESILNQQQSTQATSSNTIPATKEATPSQ